MLYGQTPKWIDRLDRLMPGFGIPNLALYLIGAQACGFLLLLANPSTIFLLVLDPSLVLKGEVWRLVTFLAVPPPLSPIWMVFVLYFLYFIVNGIEEEWGEFRTTLYVLVAVLLTIAFSFAFQWPIYSTTKLGSTLFLAAATLAPEYQILLFFVLPVKMKWLAWLSVAYIVFALIVGSWLSRLYLLTMYANYLLFFGPYFAGRLKAFYRRKKFQQEVAAGRGGEDKPTE
jgi:membrane associated rhomboid family serine protease